MKSHCLLIAWSVLLLGVSCPVLRAASPDQVFQGYLDLRGKDVSKISLIELNGEWEWYWSDFVYPGEERPGPLQYARVPGSWDSVSIHGNKARGPGYATYRIRILMDPGVSLQAGYRFPDIINSFRIYHNGQLIFQNGVPGTNMQTTRPQWRPAQALIRLDRTTNELVVQIASYRYRSNGFQQPVLLGPASQIISDRESKLGRDYFMLGVFLIIGLYHLGLFLLRRKDRSTLYFALFTLGVGLRNATTNERLLSDLLPGLSWNLSVGIEFFTMPLTAVFFILYLRVLFSDEFRDWSLWLLVPGHFLYGLIVLLTKPLFYSTILVWYHLWLVITILVILVLMIKAIRNKREGAWLVIGGFAALVFSVVNDILFVNHVIYTGHILSYGVFIFIFSQSFILSIRFSQTFRKIEDISAKLQSYNQNLSELVNSRTRELQQERNLLKTRNEIIESELDLARRIQHDLIPRVSHLENLDFYYRPMEKVGGDFFDFIQYPEPHRVGIFISDVSGHGVPAALVTSMIKSTLLQVAPQSQDPAHILKELNQALLDKTAGNFVTAFYGILDLKSRQIRYANAGHNIPYLLSEGRVTTLGLSEGSMPLSILTNEELLESGKIYVTEQLELQSPSKIFFYTDGLTEAIPANRAREEGAVPDFESSRMHEVMASIQDLPCQFFIREMAEALIRFKGNDSFEDDVCMICVDIS